MRLPLLIQLSAAKPTYSAPVSCTMISAAVEVEPARRVSTTSGANMQGSPSNASNTALAVMRRRGKFKVSFSTASGKTSKSCARSLARRQVLQPHAQQGHDEQHAVLGAVAARADHEPAVRRVHHEDAHEVDARQQH